ncbi:MAG: lysophospholipid acyltransferase family protein [Actinomycetia bacterium]|nr:lysophospholipid acyltransferase family protein [Actinomycetes bacterium]
MSALQRGASGGSSGDSAGPPPAWRSRWFQRAARPILKALYSVRVHHRERMPSSGPVIVVVNHTGFLDGPFAFGCLPRAGHFLVLDKTFIGWMGRLLTWSGQIPISQDRGDRTALGQALEVLRRGGMLGIFPEGGRGRGDLAEAGKGAAWLALQSGAVIVPVACLGTRYTGDLAASWPRLRAPLVLDLGEPFRIEPRPGVPGRVRLEHASEEIRTRLAAHVTAASTRHGIPLPTDIPPDLVT